MPEFVTVARVGQIGEGRGQRFVVGGREVAVFRVGSTYYALDDYCPHMGASLGTGEVHNGAVICNRHFWAFRLEDGACLDVPRLKAETFEVRVEGDQVQVRIPPASSDAGSASRETNRENPKEGRGRKSPRQADDTFWFIRLKNARLLDRGFSRHKFHVFSPEGARHISPGQVRRRQPPNAALGVVFRRGRSPERAKQP
jgi:nitrite reductase/ring-hydroxylating ferredoxin subunit